MHARVPRQQRRTLAAAAAACAQRRCCCMRPHRHNELRPSMMQLLLKRAWPRALTGVSSGKVPVSQELASCLWGWPRAPNVLASVWDDAAPTASSSARPSRRLPAATCRARPRIAQLLATAGSLSSRRVVQATAGYDQELTAWCGRRGQQCAGLLLLLSRSLHGRRVLGVVCCVSEGLDLLSMLSAMRQTATVARQCACPAAAAGAAGIAGALTAPAAAAQQGMLSSVGHSGAARTSAFEDACARLLSTQCARGACHGGRQCGSAPPCQHHIETPPICHS